MLYLKGRGALSSVKNSSFVYDNLCVIVDVTGENLTGWVKYTHVVESYMESVIKLMLMPRNG